MRKDDLIRLVAEGSDFTQKDVTIVLETLAIVVKEQLVQEEEIPFLGLGKFFVKERAGRTGRNPQTGEKIEIPACKVPAFKMSPSLVKELKVVQ